MSLITRPFIRALIFNRWLLFLALLPFVLGFLLYYPAVRQGNYSVCLMINVTHHPCPSCGLSRSFAYLTHGHIIKAFQYNWLLVPSAGLFLPIIIAQLLPAKQRLKLYRKLGSNMQWMIRIFTILIIIYFAYGVLRLADMHFNFIGMENVVPEKTILKYIENLTNR